MIIFHYSQWPNAAKCAFWLFVSVNIAIFSGAGIEHFDNLGEMYSPYVYSFWQTILYAWSVVALLASLIVSICLFILFLIIVTEGS